MAKYKLIITSDFSYGREYETTSRDVIRLAKKYGRAEGGEKVIVYDHRGRAISGAMWSSEDRKYIRVNVTDAGQITI